MGENPEAIWILDTLGLPPGDPEMLSITWRQQIGIDMKKGQSCLNGLTVKDILNVNIYAHAQMLS